MKLAKAKTFEEGIAFEQIARFLTENVKVDVGMNTLAKYKIQITIHTDGKKEKADIRVQR